MSGAGDNPDEALVSQVRAGNKRAFSKLVEVTDNSGDALEELPAPALGAELLKTL